MYGFTVKRPGEITDNHIELVKSHVDAMRAIIRGRVAGDGGEIGAKLSESLDEAIAKYEAS